jgi:NADH:ubiquinone oxidoreductase subunit C
MLNREELSKIILEYVPEAEIPEGTQLSEAIVPAEKLVTLAEKLKSDKRTKFDYLISNTAVDFTTHFMAVYHLDSTEFRHLIVLKVKIEDRENPEIETLAGVFPTSEFFEREVFDLFGIKYKNHPNLKRLFLEDDYGFPLRKDFHDEINMIER